MPGEMISPARPLDATVSNIRLRHVVTLSLVLAGIGASLAVSASTGDGDGDTTGLVALVFLVLALFPPVMWWQRPPADRLRIDAEGLRWDDADGDTWTVAWPELEKVTFSYTRPDTSQPRRAPMRSPVIELLLGPASPDFHDAHPEMEHLARESSSGSGAGYGMRLGNVQHLVGPIDDALSAFAAGIYVRDGRAVPRGLRRPWAVVASIALAAAFWIPAMGYAMLGTSGGGDAADLAMGSFWTAVVTAWLVRVWAGGTMAIGFLSFTAGFIGGAFLVVLGLLILTGAADGFGNGRLALAFPMSAGLLASGLLLKRNEVREWSEARTQGR
ncbi:hypothetical protein ACN3XK_16965 [Actinomadura welshii]